ncbi:MAG TPA: glycosyltransferase family A protein [Amaricoccus sp.]|jgi:cellulose synthase/poly-beta-1,6-N-acetylglucosamine synthase-like glycosyltransferase|nr:glycosyltransferase family A protein [Amaricoccus sp.]
MTRPSYVLMTAAYNEARFLPATIATVAAQTVPPALWIIVSDNSTDATDDIVREAAARHGFIRFLRHENRRPSPVPMGGTAWKKVTALEAGLAAFGAEAAATPYLGNIDGDVTFAPEFYATLMERMDADPGLGLAGGFIYHSSEGREWPYIVSPDGVGGPIQFFRRAAWDAVGGYVPWGQEDSIVQMALRMHGWGIRSFPDLRVAHHKTPKEKRKNPLRGRFHTGMMERAMRYHPLYETAKCASTVARRPAVLGSAAQLAGYTWAALKRTPSQLPPELVAFNQREQMAKLRRRAGLG